MNFSTSRAATAAGLSVHQVRGYVSAGIVAPARGPRGAFRFSFQDVVILRTGRSLNAAGIPTRRIRLAMARLRFGVPPVSLSAVTICAQGSHVVVDDPKGRWEPATGQLQLPFQLDATGNLATASSAPASSSVLAPTPIVTGRGDDWWFDEGLRLEDADPLGARAAYREAIAQNPLHGAAHANLGRLLHEQGELNAAKEHYRQALDAEGDDGTAAFNLGVVLEDMGNGDEALAAYLTALESDPGLAAAHFNAGRLLEAQGRRADALGHFAAYRKIEDGR